MYILEEEPSSPSNGTLPGGPRKKGGKARKKESESGKRGPLGTRRGGQFSGQKDLSYLSLRGSERGLTGKKENDRREEV